MIETYYKTQDVAEILDCSVSKLEADRWLKRGLPYVKIGNLVRYPSSVIEKWLHDNRVLDVQ